MLNYSFCFDNIYFRVFTRPTKANHEGMSERLGQMDRNKELPD